MRALRNGALGLMAVVLLLASPGRWAHTEPGDPPIGTITDFGVQQTALTIYEGYLGTGKDGAPMWYGVQMGEPGVLVAVDPVSRTLVDTIELPGSSGAWGVTQGSDGTVYAGSYSNAHLYSYDPETGESQDLGAPVPGAELLYGLKAGNDGTIYGGTYPDASAFSYSPTDGFTNYGTMYEGEEYVRDTEIDPERQVLWAAVGAAGHLIRMDLKTGEKTDILPEPYLGTSNSPYDLNLVDGKLMVKTSGFDAFFLDPDTGEPIPMTDGDTGEAIADFKMNSRGISPISPDGSSVFFTWANELLRYDLATDTVFKVRDADGEVVLTGGGAGIGFGYIDNELHVLVSNYAGNTLVVDLDTATAETAAFPFPPQPIPINSLSVDPEGQVYVNGFINGGIAVMDPETGETVEAGRVGQTEGWAWHNGTAYMGIYPSGKLMAYDPSAPIEAGVNPAELFSLRDEHGQSRPYGIVPTDEKVYVGTTPADGEIGGALSVYDVAAGEVAVHRDIVPDQGVTSLVLDGTTLWGGTSINGGGGTTPVATEARLFSYDTTTGAKVAELTPVAGAATIAGLDMAADGTIWGLADATVFQFDPETETVLRTIELSGPSGGVWDSLVVNSDGLVYVTAGNTLLSIDPGSAAMTELATGVSRMVQGIDGELWMRGGVNRLIRYTPESAVPTCEEPDQRSTVIIGQIDTGVSNQQVDGGCTINDLIDADGEWGSHSGFVRHVSAVTDELYGDGVITARERGRIVSAASQSDIG